MEVTRGRRGRPSMAAVITLAVGLVATVTYYLLDWLDVGTSGVGANIGGGALLLTGIVLIFVGIVSMLRTMVRRR